jgi:hypothetical protein
VLGDTVLAVARDAVETVLHATDRTDTAELCTFVCSAHLAAVVPALLLKFRLCTLAHRDCAMIVSLSSAQLCGLRWDILATVLHGGALG